MKWSIDIEEQRKEKTLEKYEGWLYVVWFGYDFTAVNQKDRVP